MFAGPFQVRKLSPAPGPLGVAVGSIPGLLLIVTVLDRGACSLRVCRYLSGQKRYLAQGPLAVAVKSIP